MEPAGSAATGSAALAASVISAFSVAFSVALATSVALASVFFVGVGEAVFSEGTSVGAAVGVASSGVSVGSVGASLISIFTEATSSAEDSFLSAFVAFK